MKHKANGVKTSMEHQKLLIRLRCIRNEPSFLSQAYFSIERCDFGISLMSSRVEQWDDNQRLLQRKKALGSNFGPPNR
jgi:hypothetical protein